MISGFYIPIDNVQKLLLNFLIKEKYVRHDENLQRYLRLGLKLKNTPRIRIQSITIAKNQLSYLIHKKNRSRKKMVTKMEKRCTN